VTGHPQAQGSPVFATSFCCGGLSGEARSPRLGDVEQEQPARSQGPEGATQHLPDALPAVALVESDG